MNPEQQLNPNQQQSGPNPAPQVFTPNPSSAQTPYGPPVNSQQPVTGPIPAINDPEDPPKSRKGLIIAVIAGVVIVLILLGAVLIAGSNKSTSSKPKSTQVTSTETQAILPAQGVEVEQINNALSQDLSRLDDEKDLPNASLTDPTLGL
jgi:hypothetical protein